MENLLDVRGISKSYNGIEVLKNVDFSLSKGEILAVLGKNGAGKSTLVKVVSGAIQADSGEMFVRGQKVNFRHPLEAIKLGISVIYQELNLFEDLSVAENILFSNYSSYPSNLNKILSMLGIIDWKNIHKRAEILCKKYGYKMNLKSKVRHLGMGEKQIVAIIKALSQNADILIMDEPFSALPEYDTCKLFNVMKQIKKMGISMVYVTHNIDEIYKVADRVVVITDGEITRNEPVSNTKADELIQSMAGKDMKDRYPKLDTNKSTELLRVEKINRNGILKDISFSLYRGEILGLTGLVGSGRSSVARAIFGADQIASGDIYVKGKRVRIKSPVDAVKHGISYIPDDRSKSGIIKQASIAKNVTIAHLQGVEQEKIRWMIDKGYENKRVKAYADRLAIKRESISQDVELLSGGNQQKVLIARWLFANTDILLFDEPTKGLDIASKVEIYNIINELTREGKGILFISSDLSEVLGMCDRILVMYGGSIVKQFMRNEASKEAILSYASGIAR